MIIKEPGHCTRLDIWSPRYKDKHGLLAQPVILIAKYKVEHATPVIIVEFSKAKHLAGQRFAIKRAKAEQCPIDSNGKIPCYAVPLNMLEAWESSQEVADTAEQIFDH